jgi:hypothetical protein
MRNIDLGIDQGIENAAEERAFRSVPPLLCGIQHVRKEMAAPKDGHSETTFLVLTSGR